jgi:SET domain-containing protein
MILLGNDYWEVQETREKGRGIFAKKEIKRGVIIGDYLGKIIHPRDAEIDDKNFYLMYYHDKAVIVPDLNRPGVHLLNHACNPNAFLYTYKGHTLAFALKNISKNEEITIPYLLSPIDEFCNPCLHVCKCADLNCSKTMHLPKDKYDKWRTFNEKWAKKTKRERISYGKELPMLKDYPKLIPENYIEQVTRLFKFGSVL